MAKKYNKENKEDKLNKREHHSKLCFTRHKANELTTLYIIYDMSQQAEYM